MILKKITSGILATSLLASVAIPSYATEISPNTQIQSAYSKGNVETSALTTEIMKSNIEDALKKGTIDKEYAAKLMVIVNKYSTKSSNSGISTRYYNSKTGAIINYIPLPNGHGQLIMNKAGFEIVREIINLGGGAATIGGGVVAVLGSSAAAALSGGLVVILGGALVVQSAAISLQFAMGNEYAICSF